MHDKQEKVYHGVQEAVIKPSALIPVDEIVTDTQ